MNSEILNKIYFWLGLSSPNLYIQKNRNVRNALLLLPIIVQIVIILGEVFIQIKYYKYFILESSRIARVASASQFAGSIIAAIVQILENLYKCRLDAKLQNKMKAIDSVLRRYQFRGSLNRKLNSFYGYKKCFLIFSLALSIDGFLMYTISDKDIIWRRNIYNRVWSKIMIRIGLLRIVLYFSWITFRLNCIHSLLKENISIKFATSQTKVEVNHLKKLYSNLWTFKQHLNERYNWTLCTAITAYFCSFLVGLYWILMRFQFQRYQSMAGNNLLLFHIFCFFLFFVAV